MPVYVPRSKRPRRKAFKRPPNGSDAVVRGRYRYSLTRWWENPTRVGGNVSLGKPEGYRVAWVMLNPSTADALEDDPTIRRVRSFTEAWGFSSFEVVNLFAFRTPSPAYMLSQSTNIVGPRNRDYIRQAIFNANLVVCAWGAADHPRVAEQTDPFVDLARSTGHKLWCLGTTRNGGPRHPLYLRADTKLERWA